MKDSSNEPGKSMFAKLRRVAFAPIDSASIVFFRVAFGGLMAWEVYRYYFNNRVSVYWLEPRFLFTYYGFSWVEPLAGNGLSLAWCGLGVLALFIAIGLFYRLSAALFFIGFTYFFLLDQATYLNHFYLICLLAFLLIFVPANRSLAVDPLLWLTRPSQTLPAWTLWIFRFQMAVVYFYGGLAKLQPDWFHGEPMRTWITGRSHVPILGRFMDEPWMPYFLSYGGLLLDLLIAPLLLWRRTRFPAFCLAVLFHFWNAHMFTIGVFPWLAMAATTIFFSPSWPRRLLAAFRRKPMVAPRLPVQLPGLRWQNLQLSLLAGYVLIQLLVPFRHLLYPGRADWTYEGHRFSWRMKLHDRDARVLYYVTDPNSGREIVVNPNDYLNYRQARKMGSRPDMILQFAHYLATIMPRKGPEPLRVQARVFLSLNGRRAAPFVDPTVDLAAEPRTLKPARWLLPLNEPLPDFSASARRQPSQSASPPQRAGPISSQPVPLEQTLQQIDALRVQLNDLEASSSTPGKQPSEQTLRQISVLKQQLNDLEPVAREQFQKEAAQPQDLGKPGPKDD